MIEIIKENIVEMVPRTFGEKVGEYLIRKLIPELEDRLDNSHDASLNGEKVEIKLSRALKKSSSASSVKELLTSRKDRGLIKFDSDFSFDCNIQQVKPDCFDHIVYGILFDDAIFVFKASKEDILYNKGLGYNDKQHRGNVGEGQFHLKRSNINFHIDNFLFKKIPWKSVEYLLN